MTTTARPAPVTDLISSLTWDEFVREIPDRAVRAVIEARDEIVGEAHACERTQSWSPRSTRSAWWSELREVVEAIDALRAAHEAVEEAIADDDLDAAEDAVEARARAFEAVEDAIEAANDRARDLADRVAQLEAEEGVEVLLREANEAGDDAEWASCLADLARRHSDGDRGWSVEVAEDGTLTVTGWAMTRGVQAQDGDRVLGDDWSDVREHEVRGRVVFQITRDDDGCDEPNGGDFPTIASVVEACESLAEVHGVESWADAWSIDARFAPVKAEEVAS